MSLPEPGQKAPDFKLPSSDGGTLSLKDLKGQQVVLYFYPTDFSEGCTKEACEFAAAAAGFKKAKTVVVGISPDPPKQHTKFRDKFGLPFTLLSDENHAVADKYGVWGQKQMFGHKFMGVIRSTFLIAPDGKIAKVWPKVRIAGHAKDVLKTINPS